MHASACMHNNWQTHKQHCTYSTEVVSIVALNVLAIFAWFKLQYIIIYYIGYYTPLLDTPECPHPNARFGKRPWTMVLFLQ